MDSLGSGIKGCLNDVSSGLSTLGDKIGGFFSTLWDWLSDILDNIKNGFLSIGNWLKDIFDNLQNLPTTIKDFLIELFKPTYSPYEEVKSQFDTKFSFMGQVFSLVDTLFSDFNSNDKPPVFSINWNGSEYTIFNFSIINEYRAIWQGVIIAIAWVNFVFWLLKFAPRLIKGGG